MPGRRSARRLGLSAPLVGVLATICLVLCLSLYALAAARLTQIFFAASGSVVRAVEEAKKTVDVAILLVQEPEFVTEGNKTMLKIMNRTAIMIKNTWPDIAEIDVIAVLDKSGNIMAEREFGGGSLALAPGSEIMMYFANISLSLSAYDQDFWLARREVGAVLVYPSGGVASYSRWGTLNLIDLSKCGLSVIWIGEEPVVAFAC